MTSTHVMILAGGQGSRFWPISRAIRPKQFLSINASGESLIAATARRAEPLVEKGNLWVITNHLQSPLVKVHVPEAKIIAEPFAKNTAASIGLAAIHLHKKDPDSVMIVLPADHAVESENLLQDCLRAAVKVAAQKEHLVTIGIPPAGPNTAYGYIKRGEQLGKNAFRVARFFEKPNLARAVQYFESGEYYWNSGMFVWHVDTILKDIKEFLPELYAELLTIEKSIGTPDEIKVTAASFAKLESISIDFGVLEHARNCAVLSCESFGWNDVGSWDAWASHFSPDPQGNLSHGETLLIEAKNCVVHSENRLTAILGVEDLIIIDSGDALLVCPRDRVQDVKRIVEELLKRGRTDLV